MFTRDTDPDLPTGRSAKSAGQEAPGELPKLVLGAGDGRGFGGGISPAKLALVDSLDAAGGGFELRIHGVGGSSAEQLLEQPQTVQVGGDQTALFVRRWGSRRHTVPWPLEGYWWGGLTSRPTTRALWVFVFPLMLCNLASWMLPAGSQATGRRRTAGAGLLPPVMRWAGYALTLLLTASLATASMDVFGWQCAMAPPVSPANGKGSPVGCLPGWLHWTPTAPGPRLVVFALVPVLVLALIGYACHRTLRAYERWRLPSGLPGDSAHDTLSWPLTTGGFWHGLRPVRRQQLLHLAGSAALMSLYLAVVPASHPGVRAAMVAGAIILLALPAVTLACPQVGRPGVNPHKTKKPSDLRITGFDWFCGGQLILSVTVLAALLLARIWWRPAPPASPVGLLPGDSAIWWALTFAMAGLVIGAAVLTAMARDTKVLKRDRPFAAGFMAPLTLGLACLTGGIFAAGLNLLLPNLLIGKQFQSTGPAISGLPSAAYPLVLPVPTYGLMIALLTMAAMTIILSLVAAGWFIAQARKTARPGELKKYYGKRAGHLEAAWRQRWRIAFSWTKARLPDYLGIAVTALTLAGMAGVVIFDGLAANLSDTRWVTWVAHLGQWLELAAVVALFGYTRQAFTDSGKRRQIGVLWDVGTFWPRASQPLGPPCYMERSVPETVNRLRRVLGDELRKDSSGTDPATDETEAAYIKDVLEPQLGTAAQRILLRQDWVLINGYSQGAPIAAAIIAQLPQELGGKVSLITVGSPLRRLYGRAFPSYFGKGCLVELAKKLTSLPDGEAREPVKNTDERKREEERALKEARWRNLVRPSDYIGSYIFDDLMAEPAKKCHIDKLLLDPPRIIPADGTTPPPIHEHSDFWPDPQAAVITRELLIQAGYIDKPVSVQSLAGADDYEEGESDAQPPAMSVARRELGREGASGTGFWARFRPNGKAAGAVIAAGSALILGGAAGAGTALAGVATAIDAGIAAGVVAGVLFAGLAVLHLSGPGGTPRHWLRVRASGRDRVWEQAADIDIAARPITTRTVYARLDSPDQVAPREVFALLVGLSQVPSRGVGGPPMTVPAAAFTLTVQLMAYGFLVLDEDGRVLDERSLTRTIAVSPEEPYPYDRLWLQAIDDPALTPARTIAGIFIVDGQMVGVATRGIQVSLQAAAPAERPAVAPGVDWVLPAGPDVPRPDLEIVIAPGNDAAGAELAWFYRSKHQAVGSALVPQRTRLPGNTADWARTVVRGIEDHRDAPDLAVHLLGRAREVRAAIPGDIWAALEAAARISSPPTILLATWEPFVPWELARVPQPWDAGAPPYLGAQTVIGRWTYSEQVRSPAPPARIEARAMAVVWGEYTTSRLPEAEKEGADLVTGYEAARVDAYIEPVLDCLKGNPAVDLLHFALHGNLDPSGTQDGIRMVDKKYLGPSSVLGVEHTSTRMVFLNACQVAGGQRSLGEYAGMAAAFIGIEVGAVIAPLWKVDDTVAREVAEQFYRAVLGPQRVSPAECLRRERRSTIGREGSPAGTRLAYLFFGHPLLRVEWSGPHHQPGADNA